MLIGVALVAVAAGLWLWWPRGGPDRPATLRSEGTSALYSLIDSRERDASPLTVSEVFGPGTASLGALTRGDAEELTDCGEALDGVSAPGCTQALRARYAGGAAAGEFVIFNLPDGRAADALVAALGKDGFVRRTADFDTGRSWAQVRAMGHYVTVSWVGPVAAGADLTGPQVALDGLTRIVQSRVVNAS
ncbi:hypothetical protein ACIBG8_16415 [Nonomuraea sp. NPDC050556]|uniref:hypothetical protein n=1 Tax=Nonomuraea sp. NPDC050556 TaxID=3364369 RepID=UPI003794E048